MSSILVINAAGAENRVALVENGAISEFYLERKKDKGIVGNIYKGRVVRVLPGMQAAFVDIGLEKAAFLYVTDIFYDPDFSEQQFDLTEGEQEEHDEAPDEETLEAGERAAEQKAAETQVAPASNGEAPAAAAPVDGAAPSSEGAVAATPSSEAAPSVDRDLGGIPAATQMVGEASTATDAEEDEDGEDEEDEDEDTPTDAMTAAVAAPVAAEAPVATAPPVPGAEGVAAAVTALVEGQSAPLVAMGQPVEGGAAVAPASATPGAAPAAEAKGELRAPREPGRGRRRRRRRGKGAGGDRPEGAEKGEKGEKPDKVAKPEQQPRRNEGRGNGGGGGRRNDSEMPPPRKTGKNVRIEDLLKVGQEVVVQVSKDPIGTKGARVTGHISIPGRHLVFMPTVDHVGISRRIEKDSERRRLREIVDRMRPAGTGFIVRTVADTVPSEKIEADIRFLLEIWNQLGKKKDRKGAPCLLHPDLDLILRATRDLFARDVEKLVIDDREEYQRVLAFIEAQDPTLVSKVELHNSDEPIFDAYGIEAEIKRATARKVWLKSGGYLIIDQAEALVAIDVNSGRYVGKKSLEETITKINLEAAKEIVYQLRLRNIGGIIIIDFIDMDKAQNRDKVLRALQEALGHDKAKTNVLKISELGLVEMTRKRVRESIGRIMHEACSYCEGKGFIKSKTSVTYEIFREIRRDAKAYREPTLVVNCNPGVADMLQGDERTELRHLMDRFNKSIQIRPQPNYHQEHYEIVGVREKRERGDGNTGGGGGGGGRGSGRGDRDSRAPAVTVEAPAPKPEGGGTPSA